MAIGSPTPPRLFLFVFQPFFYLTSFSRSRGTCSYARGERASERASVTTSRISERRWPSRVGYRIYVHTPRPSPLLVINATERPLFSTRVCSRSTSPPGIDLRPRGRGLKSVTRKEEKEREWKGVGRGDCVQAVPSSSWSRPRRGTALNPIKFLTDRRLASVAEDRPNRGIDDGQVRWGERGTIDALCK